MSLTGMLDAGNGGEAIAVAAQAARVDVATARRAIDALCPAIADQLRAKAKDNPRLAGDLASLLEDNAKLGIAGSEAIIDGGAMLRKLYGSQLAAKTALGPVVDDVPGTALGKLAAISAVAVIAAVNQQNAAMPLTGAQTAADSGGGGGILDAIIGALIAGAIQGAVKHLKTRRRRTTSSTLRKRKTSSRKTSRSASRSRKTTTRKKVSRKTKSTTRKRRTTSTTTAKALEEILGGLFGTTGK